MTKVCDTKKYKQFIMKKNVWLPNCLVKKIMRKNNNNNKTQSFEW